MQGIVPTRFLFIAQDCQSSTAEEQKSASYVDGDIIVKSGRGGLPHLLKQLVRQGKELTRGDTIKVHDLSCLPVNTISLVQIYYKMLQKGITIEIGNAALVISPDDDRSELMRLIALFGSALAPPSRDENASQSIQAGAQGEASSGSIGGNTNPIVSTWRYCHFGCPRPQYWQNNPVRFLTAISRKPLTQ